ncbi:MAG: AraC family transcriptional regulator [Planctomycetota bacterium]|jgi:AraC-like DNA-binding protein|nr:AraC family transcriptional regulator [Planctomycetota bacterium]
MFLSQAGITAEAVYAGYATRVGADWHADRRIDPYDRVWHINAGSGLLSLPERVITLRPGLAILVPCGHRFSFGQARGLSMDWAHIRFELATGLALTEAVAYEQVLPAAPPKPWRSHFATLSTADSAEPSDTLARHAAACALLAPFLRAGPVASSSARFSRVLEYIHQHLAEAISLADLADQAGLAPSSFSAAFRDHFSLSPMRFLTQRRILHAQRLLMQDELGTSEIAQRCGFSDAAHLAHRFRAVTGMSPSRYRAELRAV